MSFGGSLCQAILLLESMALKMATALDAAATLAIFSSGDRLMSRDFAC